MIGREACSNPYFNDIFQCRVEDEKTSFQAYLIPLSGGYINNLINTGVISWIFLEK
jgi:hypothetical protein